MHILASPFPLPPPPPPLPSHLHPSHPSSILFSFIPCTLALCLSLTQSSPSLLSCYIVFTFLPNPYLSPASQSLPHSTPVPQLLPPPRPPLPATKSIITSRFAQFLHHSTATLLFLCHLASVTIQFKPLPPPAPPLPITPRLPPLTPSPLSRRRGVAANTTFLPGRQAATQVSEAEGFIF